MKKRFLLLSTFTAAISVLVLAGCSGKPKLDVKKDHPAVMERTDEKAAETSPAMEPSDSGKPKDHPAH
ncbi:MAG: hypothetical protein JW863_09805 [Chitinispirillaceae bacterium]|nr:hypothetical protein [Chitinispirillaceae bacterium]